jgi:hypothetical protein
MIPYYLNCEETVIHRFRAEEHDEQMENVLYLAAGVALAQAGFSSSRKEDASGYILLTEYTSLNDEVKIRYTLFGPDTPEHILAVVEFDLSIDYNLDEQITSAIMQLLQMADIEAVPSTKAEIGEILPESPEESTNPDTRNSEVSAETEVQEVETARESQGVRLDSSFSMAVVFLLGKVTEYFHYSIAGLLMAGVTWPAESFSISLGARLSLMRVYNNADVVGGPLYLSTAGLNLKLGTGINKPYRVAFGISGGAALITVAGAEETMTKTVPYADGGVHIIIPLGKHLSLGSELFFLSIFDDDLLIMGISPAFSLSMEV